MPAEFRVCRIEGVLDNNAVSLGGIIETPWARVRVSNVLVDLKVFYLLNLVALIGGVVDNGVYLVATRGVDV
jgi:hypothetical protein